MSDATSDLTGLLMDSYKRGLADGSRMAMEAAIETFQQIGMTDAADYLREMQKAAQGRTGPASPNRCPHVDPNLGQCWVENAPHDYHIYTGDEFGTAPTAPSSTSDKRAE